MNYRSEIKILESRPRNEEAINGPNRKRKLYRDLVTLLMASLAN